MRFEFNGVQFSMLPEGDIRVRNWVPAGAEVEFNDTPAPGRNGIIPGEDHVRGSNWLWDITCRGADLAGVLAANGRMAAAWRTATAGLPPTAKVPLRYELAGRWRRVYGRPGRYDPVTVDAFSMNGNGHSLAEFRVLDPLTYDDVEQYTRLDIVPASAGGLSFPIRFPWRGVSSGKPRAGLITNAGDAETPLKAVFHGPVSNPVVKAAAGWEIGLLGTLAYDVSVTVDALAGTVTRNDGAPVHGMLTRATRLSEAVLPVGQSEVTFSGTDQTGSSYVELMWRNAHHSI